MPRQRFRRPHWMRERSPSPLKKEDTTTEGGGEKEAGREEEEVPSDWGLPEWLENWLHCRRSLGPVCFGLGVAAYCLGVWTPAEDWLGRMVPPRHGPLNTESLKFIVGPTVVVLGSAAFTGGRRPHETFNTAQINGVNSACGAFVGQHLLGGGGADRSSNNIVAAASIAPVVLSFLSAFFDYNHAYVSPLVMAAILGGACVPAWSTIFAVGGVPLDGLAVLDLSLFTMAAAMTECYLRKALIRWLGPANVLTPLATQMMTDMAFSWIACSHLVEVAAAASGGGALREAQGAAAGAGASPSCDTACAIMRGANVAALLVLLGHTIVWMQEMWHSRAHRGYLAAGLACVAGQIAYVNELGPMPLIYQETRTTVSAPPPPPIEY